MKRLVAMLVLLLIAPVTHAQNEYTLPGLDGEITIQFDSFGVPQIYAASARDLFAGQGFVHASARWWQMDWLRHTGAGRLAEWVGESAVAQDQLMRTIGIPRHAGHNLTLLSDDTAALVDAYTRGVNAWLEGKSSADLAPQYDLLPGDVTIEAWTPYDTMILQSLQALGFNNTSMFVEIFKYVVLEDAGALAVSLILPPYPYDAMPVIMEPGWIPQVNDSAALWRMTTMALVPDMTGSNNWVVSGERSITGKPLLANDTHMSVQMPSFWYENGLTCTGCPYNVYGMSIAGTPGIVIGHNRHIGWGMTSAQTDMTDFYLLEINGDGQYRYNGEWVDMEMRSEPIKVAGGEVVDFEVALTVFGPMFTAFDGYQLRQPAALHWSNADGNHSLDGVLMINRARHWDEFNDGVALFNVPGLNFVYADVEGNIGYVLGGGIPKRATGHDGSVPVSGSDDRYRWQGYVDTADNPRLYNPASGYILSANNAVIRDYPYPIAQFYDYGYRAARIETLIQVTEKHSVESFAAIQFDNYNPAADYLIPALSALTFADETLADAVTWLESWDRQNDADSPQAALFNVLWVKLLRLALDELPLYDGAHSVRMMDLLMQSRVHPLWRNVDENLFSREDILKRALREAWDEMTATYGDDREVWRYGDFHRTRFQPALLNYVSVDAAVYEQLTPVVETSGGFSSPNVGNYNPMRGNFDVINIPTMRMILDFSDFGESLFVNSTGQSDNPESPHYADQVGLWAAGKYRRSGQ